MIEGLLGPAIVRLFETAQTHVYSRKDLVEILAENRENNTLPQSTTLEEFVDFLSKHGLKKTTLTSDQYPAITKYCWGNASPFELGGSLRPNSYLSHGTAIFLHGLTDQFPATIYSNKEQSEKPQQSRSSLSQEGIDRAFKNKQRESAYVLKEGRWRFVLLSGQNTNRLEVGRITGPSSEQVEATKLERTLVDITVRPTYAGGVFEVRRASTRKRSSTHASVSRAPLRRLTMSCRSDQSAATVTEPTARPFSHSSKEMPNRVLSRRVLINIRIGATVAVNAGTICHARD